MPLTISPPRLELGAPSTVSLDRALATMGQGVFVVNDLGCCTYVNRAAAEALERAPAEIIGEHMHDLLHAGETETPHRLEACQLTIALRRPTETYVGRATLARRDVGAIEVELRAYPYVEADGRRALVVMCTDITAQRRMQEDSLFNQVLLHAQSEASLDGILVVAADTKMVSFNQRFVDIWGVPADVVASRSDEAALAWVLRTLVDPDAFIRKVTYLYEHPGERSRDTIALKDGRTLDRFSTPVTSPEGVYYGRVWFFRDISDLKRAEAEMARLYAEAQEAIQLRDTFLSIASHELRTPLTSLQLQVQNLASRLSRPSARAEVPFDWLASRVDLAAQHVRRMGALVDDLLDIARITSRRLDFHPEAVDLGDLAREIGGRYEAAAEVAGSRISFDGDDRIVGHWDRMRLDQVITNLVSNAVKYGLGRPIRITTIGDAAGARLSVSDQGGGVAPADHERIFDRFERAVTGTTHAGFGVGLWIVREIVHAMGGEIGVDSAPGAGATFTVTLPYRTGGTGMELSDEHRR